MVKLHGPWPAGEMENGTYIPEHGFVLADKPLGKQQAVAEHEVDGQPFRIPRESRSCLQAFQNNYGN